MVLQTKMDNLLPNLDGEPVAFNTPSIDLKIATLEDVWGIKDSSSGYLLSILERHGILDKNFLEGTTVLDLGTGTGVLGLVLHGYGASRVDLVDNNPSAVDNVNYNIKLNDLNRKKIRAIESDCFRDLDHKRYDLIIGNFPMSPDTQGQAHAGNKAYLSNENGPTGRHVLDEAIEKARRWLKPNGRLIFTSSSRQNSDVTTSILNDYFGRDWMVLNPSGDGLAGVDQELKGAPGEYHAPYIRTWEMQSLNNNQFRIYKRDEYGRPILEYREPEITSLMFHPVNQPETLMLKVQNGVPEPHFYTINDKNQRINYTGDADEIEIPDFNPDQPYMHTYTIIMCTNKVREG